MILISTYVILKNGNIPQNKQLIINCLSNNLSELFGDREYEIVKRALNILGVNLQNYKEKLSYKPSKAFLFNMTFLNEARVYCIEQTCFN